MVEGVATDGRRGMVSRLQVMRDLSAIYEAHGLVHQVVVKEGVRHQEERFREEVQGFVIRYLRSVR